LNYKKLLSGKIDEIQIPKKEIVVFKNKEERENAYSNQSSIFLQKKYSGGLNSKSTSSININQSIDQLLNQKEATDLNPMIDFLQKR